MTDAKQFTLVCVDGGKARTMEIARQLKGFGAHGDLHSFFSRVEAGILPEILERLECLK